MHERFVNQRRVVPPAAKFKTVPSHIYREIYRDSLRDLAQFWAKQAENLIWRRRWVKVLDGEPPRIRWFVGGALSAYENIVLRHQGTEVWNKPAVIYEDESGETAKVYTYEDLDDLVRRYACVLKLLGVDRGDWVVIYAPPNPDSLALMLASVRIGAPFEAVFTGFGASALKLRIKNRNPKLVFAQAYMKRRGKSVNIGETALKAVTEAGVNSDLKVLMLGGETARRNGVEVVSFEETSRACSGKGYEGFEATESDHPLFGLHPAYEDGCKPMTHSVGGFLVQVYATTRWIGLRPNDTYFCTVWPGWITGISYVVFGPLMVGAALVLYDGAPDYPDWGRWLSIIDRYSVTVFLTTSGALRILSKQSPEIFERYNLDTLKLILVTAEPLEADVWDWAYRTLGAASIATIDSDPSKGSGRIPVINMYIQSEIGTFITGETFNYIVTPLAPGSAGIPMPGFWVDVVDEELKSAVNRLGKLVVRSPWPAMPIEYPEEFEQRWKGGMYDTGDLAYMAEDGHVYAVGRWDAVLKVSGYRLSPADIEEAAMAARGVRYTIAAGHPHPIRFEAPYVLVVGRDANPYEIRVKIREEVGAIADPHAVAIIRDETFADRLAQIDKRDLRRRIKNVFWGLSRDPLADYVLSKAEVFIF